MKTTIGIVAGSLIVSGLGLIIQSRWCGLGYSIVGIVIGAAVFVWGEFVE